MGLVALAVLIVFLFLHNLSSNRAPKIKESSSKTLVSKKNEVGNWAGNYQAGNTTWSTNIVIKKEFFFWPLGFFLRKMGAIPIDRSKGTSVVKQIIKEMNSREVMHLAITPEGTRHLNKRWKAGFHTIAKATGAVVYLGFFDFGRKEIGWIDTLELTDDADNDIRSMKAYYRNKGIIGKYPDQFTAED